MTMKKKKYNARFPPARIKKIMQTDEDVGKVAQPVPVIISRALELFVENLLKKANDITSQRGAKTLTPSHLKMCIKSEQRFDFLKELVTSVPDLQGDHDDPLSTSSAVGLDLTMSTLTAAADQSKINTSSLAASRPAKLPRQLSTPRPRGRPRTVSLDSESKIPKKKKKKRQPKYVDDDIDELSDAASNNGDTAADEVFDDNDNNKLKKIQETTASAGNDPAAIVTCTVTTGLTPHSNGFNNGSILGFTLSIPSTSLMSSPPATSLSQQNGTLSTEAKDSELNHSNAGAAAHKTNNAVQDVDEDYDDC